MAFISMILAILKAFPILDKWFDQIHNAKIEQIKLDIIHAVENADKIQDQRPIEIAIGSSEPGLPSGTPGAIIVKKVKGVE